MSHSANSAEMDIFDPVRAELAQTRQEAIAALIDDRGLDAALLTNPANLAWITCGADLSGGAGGLWGGDGGGNRAAAVFLTRQSRVVVCSDADSPHLFDRELPGLGFQLKQRPWHRPLSELFHDLCRGRVVGSDRPRGFEEPIDDPTDLRAALATLRATPSAEFGETLRELGADVAHAVEATCRGASPGRTESDFAGEIAHRLLRRGVMPVRIWAAGDGRADDQPHYAFDRRPALTRLAVRAVGRRSGLHVHCGRTVAFPSLGAEQRTALLTAHARAVQIQAVGLHHAPGRRAVVRGVVEGAADLREDRPRDRLGGRPGRDENRVLRGGSGAGPGQRRAVTRRRPARLAAPDRRGRLLRHRGGHGGRLRGDPHPDGGMAPREGAGERRTPPPARCAGTLSDALPRGQDADFDRNRNSPLEAPPVGRAVPASLPSSLAARPRTLSVRRLVGAWEISGTPLLRLSIIVP